MSKIIDHAEMGRWAQAIGGLIINFGLIEFLTLRWIERIDGEKAAMAVRGDILSKRIAAVLGLIPQSRLAEPMRKSAEELWQEVATHAKLRNRVAHNPIAVGLNKQNGLFNLGVVELRKMEPNGENALVLLEESHIRGTALRLREIARELTAIIESAPGT